MAINVITGQPRNGKSQCAVGLIILDKLVKENDKREKEGKPRLPIYTDIDGINALTTPTKIPDCITEFEREKIWFGEHDDPNKPDGFWCPPYGSKFLFDECHKREWVVDSSGNVSKHPTAISLNEHGHAGHDIWLITQFPQYIHTHIRGLVQEHWHVKRIAGLRQAYIYKWDEFMLNPRAKVNLDSVFEKQRFKFKKRYEQAYKSASAHAKISFKFPKVLYWYLVPLVIIVGLLVYKLPNSMFGKKLGIGDKQTEQVEQTQDQDPATKEKIDSVQKQTTQQLEEINKLRFELEELKAKYLPQHINQLAEHEDVRPAMVISNNGACLAFNRYGEPLALPDELCWQMDKYPALIPRTRVSTQNLSSTLPPETNNSQPMNNQLPAQSQPAQQNTQYFDHNKDFS